MRFSHLKFIFCIIPHVLCSHDAKEQHVISAEELTHLLPLTDVPSIGFGTWNIAPKEAKKAVSSAIEAGYRHIDCAATYGNEKDVGAGIAAGMKKTQTARHDIWITSKLWNTAHDPQLVGKALNQTLLDLGLEYLDLYLMHWPVQDNDGSKSIEYLDTWDAMTKLPKELVRNIGISNFSPAQLTQLIATHPLSKPYLHQFETHPYLPQTNFLATHSTLGIKVTAYSPLGNTNPTYSSKTSPDSASESETETDPAHPSAVPALISHPSVVAIATAHECTPAQVLLAWGIHRGTSVIPKTTNPEHMASNLAVNTTTQVNRCITAEDAQTLAALPVMRFNNPSVSWGVSLFEGLEGVEIEQLVKHQETLMEEAEEFAVAAAKWGVMEMWAGVKGAWWFATEMLGDDGY